ncbi:hypothetical protein Gohar_004384 [Gossypium harknessii]|uniref:Reverse transcriptase zinc-binding domain-containing protein n=1 Tax=Gossypium harknessii TaxID=34285 RepID=A0A7J9H5C0_9ROSI|nr:hypothetical protein [Gossypium harknessii]
MVSVDGNWNLELFQLWVPRTFIRKIIGIPPPHPEASVDKIIWVGSTTGSFSIKNAYGRINTGSWKLKEDTWKIHWNFKGLQKVGFFIWLILKQRLLTSEERVRRGLGQSSIRGVCSHISEDVLHVLRDCLTAEDIWNLLIPTNRLIRFYSSNTQEWIASNLLNQYDICFMETSHWNIYNIPREENQEADNLARLAHSGRQGLRMFGKPPCAELG